MKVFFKSRTDDDSIEYYSNASLNSNIITFDDKSMENTQISLEVIDDKEIVFERKGQTNMIFNAKLNEFTHGNYNNNLGLEFKMQIFTKDLSIESNQIYLNYDFYIENEYQNTHEIWVLIK